MVKVIVVDDLDIWREQFSRIAAKVYEGVPYEVTELETADELVKTLTDEYDLVLTDNRTGQGRRGIDAIRELSHKYSVPMFLISSDNLEHEVMNAGGAGYFFKRDFDMVGWAQSIRDYLISHDLY